MTTTDKPPVDESILARFVPINGIEVRHLKELGTHAEIITVEDGKPIELGRPRSPFTFYLVEGEIQILSGSRVTNTIFGRTEQARFSLSHMGDDKHVLRAGSRVKLLKLERSKISTLLIWSQSGQDNEKTWEKPGGVEPVVLSSEIFSRIPAPNVQRIRTLMESVPAKAGDVVIQQGGPGDYYYVLRHGRCKVTRQMEKGKSAVELAQLEAGDTFGEEALISDSKRNATVTMMTDGELLRLTKENFIELIRDPLINSVNFAAAMGKVSSGAKLLDVRLSEEHANDGIPGSLNIPLSSLRSRMGELKRSQPYIVYCSSGKRSSAAAFLLSEKGFEAYLLEGGLHSTKEAGGVPARTMTSAAPAVTEDPAMLHKRLIGATHDLETAIHQKAVAETEKRFSTPARSGAASGAGKDEEHKLEKASRIASEQFERAKLQKREIEAKLRNAEASAAGERKKAEAIVQKLRREAESRLKQEDERLKREYSEAAEKIDSIRRAKEEAEARFTKERERLEAELAKAQSEIASEASRVQQELKTAQATAEKRAQQIRESQSKEEERLRAELEERLKSERKRLESEFAQTVTSQEKAKQQLIAAENARKSAKLESDRIARELKAAQEKRRAAERARVEQEKKRLEHEAAEALAKLEAAEQEKMELTTAKLEFKDIMNAIRDEEASLAQEKKESDAERELRAELEAHNAKMKAAEAQIETAMRAKADADQAKAEVEEKVATQQAVEEELRVQLYEEMEEWLDEERTRSEKELAAARKIAIEQAEREKRIDEERRLQAEKEAELLSDVGSQISDLNPEDTLSRETTAEMRASLARSARDEALAEKEKAKSALEAARARINSLKKS